MSAQKELEQRNRRVAMATSIGIHVLVVLLFLFVVAWKAPNPPNAEYGIELNFGMDRVGSGDVQPEKPVTSEEAKPTPEEQQQTEEVKPVESTKEEATPEPIQSQQESIVETKKQEEKKVEKKVVVEKPVVEKKETAPVLMPKKTTETVKQPVSQGDNTNKAGDKGDEKGSVDAKALMGKQGGGQGGSSLDLAGWDWDEIPKPQVPDNETGQIVFEIKVDERGEVTKIVKLSGAVSAAAENACKKAIQDLSFTKIGASVPKETTGRITFVIVAK